ncbi:MAG: 1-acyl-sn-glycerol-3-phosphate acyltransferase [Clostridiales bacterium]|nr:1-acyl-sn-glycerol-3-phosphate acyltransferase [Clostridiales bacterium]
MATKMSKGADYGDASLMYQAVHFLLQPIRYKLFGMKRPNPLALPEGPCLILANHSGFYDPTIMISVSPRQIHFVAEGHLFHHRIMNLVLVEGLGCIPCEKGKLNSRTVFQIFEKIKHGKAVGLFGSGNITYDGAVEEFPNAIGKLAKALKCNVVTVRIRGSYLMKPRWSKRTCRGRITCETVNIYSPEKLAGMTSEEVTDRLNRDVYLEEPSPDESGGKRYRRSAEGLQLVLYMCPVCSEMMTVTPKGRRFVCENCHAEGILNPYGFIDSQDFPFRTIYEWNRWQSEQIRLLAERGSPIHICSHEVELVQILPDYRRKRAAKGDLVLTDKSLACGETQFPIEEIVRMDTRDKGILLFSTRNGDYFEASSRKGFPGLLFKTAYRQMAGKSAAHQTRDQERMNQR